MTTTTHRHLNIKHSPQHHKSGECPPVRSAMSSSRLSVTGAESSDGCGDCASGCSSDGGGDSFLVPMERDTLTFAGRQACRIKEMEKRVEEEMHKKKRRWEREVERMRDEFLELYPCDRHWGSEELLNDPMVSRRRGSTDILDKRKMRTLFMEYPDAGRRYKLRFNCREFEPLSVKVTCEENRIIVSAKQKVKDEKGNISDIGYVRKIERPREVDSSKLRSFLTMDGILIVEAPVPPQSLNLRKLSHSPSHSSQASHTSHGSHCSQGSRGSHGSSSRSRSPSNSPHTPSTHGQKHNIPHFNEDVNGIRRFSMIVDVGTCFKPQDITVQVIKENRIQIKAKHEERTSERLSKNKFSKEYELPEKIEHYTLRGGLTSDGRLIVGALAKGELNGMSQKEAGDAVTQEINAKSDTLPCNVLDLATFPPVNPAANS